MIGVTTDVATVEYKEIITNHLYSDTKTFILNEKGDIGLMVKKMCGLTGVDLFTACPFTI